MDDDIEDDGLVGILENEIQKAKHRAAIANEIVKKLEQCYRIYLEVVKLSEQTIPLPPRRTRSNQKVASAIKEAITTFKPGQRFSARAVFDVINAEPESNFNYSTIRPSISAWLQYYTKKGIVQKSYRGVYVIPKQV